MAYAIFTILFSSELIALSIYVSLVDDNLIFGESWDDLNFPAKRPKYRSAFSIYHMQGQG